MRRREVLYDRDSDRFKIIAKDDTERYWFVERAAGSVTEAEALEFAEFLEWRDRGDS